MESKLIGWMDTVGGGGGNWWQFIAGKRTDGRVNPQPFYLNRLKAGIIKIFQGIAVLICSSNIFQGNISQLSSKPIVTILNNLDLVPDQWQLAVRNNGGGWVKF